MLFAFLLGSIDSNHHRAIEQSIIIHTAQCTAMHAELKPIGQIEYRRSRESETEWKKYWLNDIKIASHRPKITYSMHNHWNKTLYIVMCLCTTIGNSIVVSFNFERTTTTNVRVHHIIIKTIHCCIFLYT